MTDFEKIKGLPTVTQADITAAFTDDVMDSDVLVEWMRIFGDNVYLAMEIRDRAHTEATLSCQDKEISGQQADRFIHMGTYVLLIIKHAIQRERTEEIKRTTDLRFSDGVGDEGLQL